jgi:antitoxin component YwqK of YwqJK toxin-antitoxin module
MEQRGQLVNKFFYGKFLVAIVFCFAIWSCSDKSNKSLTLSAAKHYPSSDIKFSKRQDTVLYNSKRFSGYIYQLFPTGDTAFVLTYLNGLQEGKSKKWYPNRQLKEERFYAAGHKQGLQMGWWPDGKPKFIFEANNDDYAGAFKEWFSSGKIAKYFYYQNGHEQGSQKAWWPDGTIRANYVILNGEKFGLFGQKLCINKNLKQNL